MALDAVSMPSFGGTDPLDDGVAHRTRRDVPGGAEVVAAKCTAHNYDGRVPMTTPQALKMNPTGGLAA